MEDFLCPSVRSTFQYSAFYPLCGQDSLIGGVRLSRRLQAFYVGPLKSLESSLTHTLVATFRAAIVAIIELAFDVLSL